VEQLSNDGVFRKLFKTKYMIFEYTYDDAVAIIVKHHYLNVWNLVNYDGSHPVSMQIKNQTWYNIRPSAVSKWYDATKTPRRFIEAIIKCINQCNQIEMFDKLRYTASINRQFNDIECNYVM
jgi:hypothetical protein